MIALVGAVFLASLVGSLHCAGMCGAFVVAGTSSSTATQVAYHLGRLATYSALGAVAGTIGASVDFGGSLLGVQRLALLLAAAAMVLFGVFSLLQLTRFARPIFRAPALLRRVYVFLIGRVVIHDPVRRALLIGLLSTLLPCGWLYAFVTVAAGAGTPQSGALVMAVFWVGTVPVLAAIGVTQGWLGRTRRTLAVLAAVALVVVGLIGITHRWSWTPLSTVATSPTVATVEHIHEQGPACCRPEE